MATFRYFAPADELAGSGGGQAWSLARVSATAVVLEAGDFRLVLGGSGFALGPPAAGTIDSATLSVLDTSTGSAVATTLMQCSGGLALSFSGLLAALAAGGSFAVSEYLFSGNDSLVGSAAADGLSGWGGADTLAGGDGADVLDGGSGADRMVGGNSSDLYYVADAGDVVVESAGGGSADRVVFSNDRGLLAYTLPDQVENLVVLNSAYPPSQAASSATGNALANRISVSSYYGTGFAVALAGAGGADRLASLGGADTLDGGSGTDTLLGGRGSDTYRVDSAADVVIETLEPAGAGDRDKVVFGAAAATVVSLGGSAGGLTNRVVYAGVEDLQLGPAGLSAAHHGIGSAAANALTGNAAANRLYGLAGNDTLDGAGGIDTLVGGTGNDRYVVGSSGEQTVELAGEGLDTVSAGLSWTLAPNVEALELGGAGAFSGTGNAAANALTGNAAANTLSGLAGADTLDGGAGADAMAGGPGNDRYHVDSLQDSVTELAGEGTDEVTSTVSFTLAPTLEHLVLAGSAAISGTGNAAANRITGNAAANRLEGGGGNDTLDGGAGYDTLVGGAGNDRYLLSQFGDLVEEAPAGGTDTVVLDRYHSQNYTLPLEVENGMRPLDAVAFGGTGYALTGNALGNRLDGSGLRETLDGGAGADTLAGHGGDDVFRVDAAGDVVIELPGEGNADGVRASVSFTLPAEVENLSLEGGLAIDATGNAGPNTLTGNAGANVLDGGAGADTMRGAGGNDVYRVDVAGDIVSEQAFDSGRDRVESAVSFTLPSYIEDLSLVGTGALTATGNAVDNEIRASAAASANRLVGAAGFDTLIGSAAADTVVLDSTTGVDSVLGFAPGSDRIEVSQSRLPVGDGDTAIEGPVVVTGPGGFGTGAELVIVRADIAGTITLVNAAAAIGAATSAYAVGARVLFVVDNGSHSALLRFVSADGDAQVESGELAGLAVVLDVTTLGGDDFVFGA